MRMATIDADGIYLGMEDVAAGKASARHLQKVTSCDLPPGKYKWIVDAANPFGGAFWPIDYLASIERTKAEKTKAEKTKDVRPGETRKQAFKRRMKNGAA